MTGLTRAPRARVENKRVPNIAKLPAPRALTRVLAGSSVGVREAQGAKLQVRRCATTALGRKMLPGRRCCRLQRYSHTRRKGAWLDAGAPFKAASPLLQGKQPARTRRDPLASRTTICRSSVRLPRIQSQALKYAISLADSVRVGCSDVLKLAEDPCAPRPGPRHMREGAHGTLRRNALPSIDSGPQHRVCPRTERARRRSARVAQRPMRRICS